MVFEYCCVEWTGRPEVYREFDDFAAAQSFVANLVRGGHMDVVVRLPPELDIREMDLMKGLEFRRF